MRIVFCPYTKANPYHRHLARELEKLGASIEPMLPRVLLKSACVKTRHVQVLHIHWTTRLLLGSTWLESLFRSVMCLTQVTLCRLLGRRIVWTVHNLGSHERRFHRMEALFTTLLAHVAHRVIVHSEAAAARVARAFHISSRKICVIPHAHYIDDYENSISPTAARQQLGITADAFVFLFLGNVRSYKGLGELVDAFGQLKQADARLVIAGRPLDDQINRQVREMIAGDPRIDYRPGFVKEDQVQVFFNAADAVVLPFTDVLTSGSLLLAMSFARPCVIPDLATLTEVMPAEGGIVYDSRTSGALAAAMRQACEHRADLPAMGEANLRAVRAWGWPEVARATFQVYGGQPPTR